MSFTWKEGRVEAGLASLTDRVLVVGAVAFARREFEGGGQAAVAAHQGPDAAEEAAQPGVDLRRRRDAGEAVLGADRLGRRAGLHRAVVATATPAVHLRRPRWTLRGPSVPGTLPANPTKK